MNRLFANSFTCVLIGLLSLLATTQKPSGKQWIGTWATAPQPPEPGMSRASGTKLCALSCTSALAGQEYGLRSRTPLVIIHW